MGKGCGCGASKAVRVPSVSAQPVVQDEDDEAHWHLYVSWTNEEEQASARAPSRPPTSGAGSTESTGAVRLSYLLDFVDKRMPLGDTNMPTWSVALNIIQPATVDTGVPYAALPEMAQQVLPVGAPQPYYFVSHAWSRPLRETVVMLAHHFRGRDPRDIYLWLDIFAVRQLSFTAVVQDLDVAVLDAALKNSSGVLLCLDEVGVALRRTWCLYEAWVGATAPAPRPASAATDPPGQAAKAGGGGGVAPIGLVALTPRALLPEERARLFGKIDIRQSRCKYRSDRDALLASARAGSSGKGLDRVNHTLRLALMLQPLVADVYPDLYPGKITEVPQLWDMRRVDGWLSLPESSKNFQAMALYGSACSGKSIAAAALAAHLRAQGIPVAAHFCNVSDVRTLDPIAVVVSLALQLAQAPRIGPRLLRQYGELSAGLMADLMSYNNSMAALEAAVEALLVRPLQRLLQPNGGAASVAASAGGSAGGDGDSVAATPSAAAASAGAGREWHDNDDMGARGAGCDEEEEEEEEEEGVEEGEGGPVKTLGAGGAKSMRAQSMRFVAPKTVVLIIDGVDQADGAIMGGAAPYDNQVLQLIEEHLPKLPSFVRLVLTSRSLSYIVPRLADRLSPLELSPEALRPVAAFMRNVRLAVATIEPSLSRRQRAAAAASLVTKSRGSLLYIKIALCCLELERDAAQEEAEYERRMVSYNGRDNGGSSGGAAEAELSKRSMSRSVSTKKLLNVSDLPAAIGPLCERYLALRLRLLDGTDNRNRAATVLAVLAAAREPLTAMQVAATASSSGAISSSGAPPPPPLLAPPVIAADRLLPDFVARGLGALVRLRGRPGHIAQEAMVVHSAVSEWLQQPKPRILLAGSVVVDVAAGHRALASHCRDDALGCLHRGRLTPYSYSVRHVFLHVGLAAMAATAPDGAGGISPASPISTATTARSSAHFRTRTSMNSAANAAAVALASALAVAAASADWIATLELLLQRLDLWTSIYAAGAGASARWVVLALASLPMCSIPAADPASTESSLLMLLAEARRWLLLYHGQLCWFPLAVVASAATLPEDSALRGRALEFSAGPDPWEARTFTTTTVTASGLNGAARPAAQQPQSPTPPPSTPPPAQQQQPHQQQQQQDGSAALSDPREEQHLLLLSTGDCWSPCVQTLRTNLGRVLHVAMQPAGRLVATVHDGERGIVIWDLWGARPLLTMAKSYTMGRNPTAAYFTPDGQKLVCAARSVFVWDVATGRLLLEFCKAAPRKAASGSRGTRGGGGAGEDGGDPDGPVMALAMSPGGGRVAAGHGNGTTRVWDLSNSKLASSMSVSHKRPVTALAFAPPLGATLVVAHGEGADAAPKAGAPVGADELGDVPTALIKADELTIHVWRIQGSSPKELEILKGHTGRVNSLVFSSLDNHTLISGAGDETIRIWWDDPKTPQSDYRQLFILGGAGQGVVHAIQFSPAPPTRGRNPHDGKGSSRKLGDADGDLPAVDLTAASAACLATAAFGTNADPRDGSGAATPEMPSSARGSTAGVQTEAGSAVAASGCSVRGGGGGDDGSINGGGLDPRGDVPVMAYSCGSGIIRLWSPTKKRQIGLLRGMDGVVSSLSFSGDGRLLAAADQSDTGVVRVWDVGGATCHDALEGSPSSGAGGLPLKQQVELMALSPDGSRLAVVCADMTKENVRVIDVFTGRRLALMGNGGAGGHEGKINAVAWSWDSSRVATGSDDLTVRVWYVAKPTAPPGNPLAAAAAIVAAELESRDRDPPAEPATSGDGAVNAAGGSRSASRTGSRNGGRGAAAAVTAAAAAATDGDGALTFRPGQCQLVLSGHHRKVQCVAWAHSGKKLASGGYDQMVRIWDSATGEQLTLIYQVAWVSSLAFSPDDARLASGAGGKAVFMFNSTTGKNLVGTSGQTTGEGGGEDSWMAALRFSPDGTLLACRDMHSCITLWDVSGMRLRPLRALDGTFREALFCPTSGDLQLYDLTATGALVMHAIPARSLPLGRAIQRSVTLSHPLLEFRGVATDAAVNHNAVVLLTADNRAFFFVNGAHLEVVRHAASKAERTDSTTDREGSWFGADGGAARRRFGGGD